MSRYVIGQQCGGLGDNLQFSTLPELLTKHGHEVFVSSKNVLRNSQTKKLVWEMNPYVSGFTDDDANLGWNPIYPTPMIYNLVSVWEKAYLGKIFNIYPKIYYNPCLRGDFVGKTILEFNTVTFNYDSAVEVLPSKIESHFEDQNVVIIDNSRVSRHSLRFDRFKSFKTYVPSDIFDFCDIIFSCKKYISLLSGGTILASALRQNNLFPKLICFCPQVDVNGRGWIFDNVDYFPVI
jgi:hypothetical protein